MGYTFSAPDDSSLFLGFHPRLRWDAPSARGWFLPLPGVPPRAPMECTFGTGMFSSLFLGFRPRLRWDAPSERGWFFPLPGVSPQAAMGCIYAAGMFSSLPGLSSWAAMRRPFGAGLVLPSSWAVKLGYDGTHLRRGDVLFPPWVSRWVAPSAEGHALHSSGLSRQKLAFRKSPRRRRQQS